MSQFSLICNLNGKGSYLSGCNTGTLYVNGCFLWTDNYEQTFLAFGYLDLICREYKPKTIIM